MSRRVTLHEYTPHLLTLHAEDVRELRTTLSKHISVVPSYEPGVFELNPSSFVGVVHLPSGLTLDLLPKVPLYNVMWMIAEVERLEDIGYRTFSPNVQIKTFDDILEPIARAFVNRVEHLIDRGLYRTYIEQEDNLTAIRGRIEFREDLNRNVVLRHRTYCRFTEFSWDVPENQVIRQVVRKLLGWGFSQRLTGRLNALDRQMEDITLTNLRPHDIDRFQYSRQSEHYRSIHRFCRLFLDGFSLSEQIGDSPFDGFVMDMNVLFEKFVAIKIRQHLAAVQRTWRLSEQRSEQLFEVPGYAIRPDLVLENDGRAVLVADTKYKRRSGGDSSSADFYQMIAYCSVLQLDTGILIYPRHLTEIDLIQQVRGIGTKVREVSVDLRESQDRIEADFLRLTERMVGIAVGELVSPLVAVG